jgi:ankyrin repeat protein
LAYISVTGHTALAWAAFKGHDQIILYLIRRGADATIADVTGMTPLHWAAQKVVLFVFDIVLFPPKFNRSLQGHKDCVKIICERSNADLTAKDKQGSTSVQHAESKGHNSIVSYLKHALSVPIKRYDLFYYYF